MIKRAYANTKAFFFSPLGDFFKTVVFLLAAYFVSKALHIYTGNENNSALVFVLAVVIISRITNGYFFGLTASIIGVFCVNYYFMYPYTTFDLTLSGYPVAFLSMLVTSITICALTSRTKQQAAQAVEREKSTKALYELNERLASEQATAKMQSEKEKMRGNLLRAISHDLRTPLTAIWGASSVVLEKGCDLNKSENIRLISDIKEDSEWLIRMIENLLSVTSINEEAAKLKKNSEAVEEVVAEAVVKTRKRFLDRKISVRVPDELLMVPMDAMLIEQVLINLLENAIRHSGDQENIKLIVYVNDEYAIFEVSDRGKGIDNISSYNSGDFYLGTGIGLSVCKSIIKAHGGYLEAENNAAGGALIRFGLSLKGESVDES